ncbi:heparan-alpha-glucosaminide n-acetyltransferase-like protein 2 [Dermatophagoides farinae]|uniref:Heparan-alpha-glucosaminide n-acetyltransferase-like protein 2 n=1 Tax=Dermatophagoides farinae TaxID=6954 RepID=A0A9D4NXA3_DERFA|nr:heparan-alpha-glucosaminide n-acetyltransferase-like protein 2 [Dermatophagoides farinae]
MVLDTFHIDLINQSNETLYFYRQFTNCYKCPLILKTSIHPGQKRSIELRSYFTQAFAISHNNDTFWLPRNDSCNDPTTSDCASIQTIDARDKSRYQLLINSQQNCHIEMLESGENQWIPAMIVIVVYLVAIFSLIYGHQYIVRIWKNFLNRHHSSSPPSTLARNNTESPTYSYGTDTIDTTMAIMLMIFVNYGAGQYKSLQHVPWDGFHLADVVFPFFIFAMGMSIAVSFKNIQRINDNRYQIIDRIVRRSIKLFVLGIIVNSIGAADIGTIRIPGVLQRFALSYGIVATVQLVTVNLISSTIMPRCLNCIKLWPQYALALIMILIYGYLSFGWRFDPNCPIGYTGPGGLSDNVSYPFCIGGAAHRIDQLLFTRNHCYRGNFAGILFDQGYFNLWHDPEGLLGTTNSIVLTIIGLQVGHTVLHNVQPWARFRRFINMIAFLALTTIISVYGLKISINKNLWSISFVTFNGCLATIVFAILHYLIDLKRIWPMGKPLNYPGQNSIALYLGHEIANDMLPFKLANSYSTHWQYLAQNLFAVTIWLWISYWLAINDIFIKV